MIRWALVPILAVSFACTAEPDPASRIVLLTGYAPFDGRGVNGSETVARALDGERIADARVRIAVLPVRWGEPERRLPGLIADAAPVLVLGLGEGYPDRVAVERVGRNRAAQPDEDGHEPAAPTLVVDGPASRAATVPFDAAWFAGSPIPVVPSEDAGSYLCNAWLYTAAGLVGTATATRVGFVHLPPQGSMPSDRYRTQLVPIVRTLIERTLAAR